MLGDPAVMKFSLNGPLNEEQIVGFIQKSKNRYKKEGVGLWAAELKGANRLIGLVGLPIQEVEGESQMELGYRLASAYWGCGYATEAAIACRDYTFNNLKKRYLISMIEKENTPSIRVAERVGMTWEREATVWGIQAQIYSIRR